MCNPVFYDLLNGYDCTLHEYASKGNPRASGLPLNNAPSPSVSPHVGPPLVCLSVGTVIMKESPLIYQWSGLFWMGRNGSTVSISQLRKLVLKYTSAVH